MLLILFVLGVIAGLILSLFLVGGKKNDNYKTCKDCSHFLREDNFPNDSEYCYHCETKH
jgi:hypothetical protein